jgi:hypothetical protein
MSQGNGGDRTAIERRRVRILVSYEWLAGQLKIPTQAIRTVVKPLEPRYQQHLFVEIVLPQAPEVPEGQPPPLVMLEYPVTMKPVQDTGIVVPQ